tara:strand:- start:5851 stop:6099 length:249 start_codon:yes stop_codon:yes gene_type:complete
MPIEFKEYSRPLNPTITIKKQKYRVMGVRDTKIGAKAILWKDGRMYEVMKFGQSVDSKKGKWSTPALLKPPGKKTKRMKARM